MTMNDKIKTLQILREAGKDGVHSFILNNKVGTFRAAARVAELKKQGYAIVSKPRVKLGGAIGCVYYLLSEPIKTIQEEKVWDYSTGKAKLISQTTTETQENTKHIQGGLFS